MPQMLYLSYVKPSYAKSSYVNVMLCYLISHFSGQYFMKASSIKPCLSFIGWRMKTYLYSLVFVSSLLVFILSAHMKLLSCPGDSNIHGRTFRVLPMITSSDTPYFVPGTTSYLIGEFTALFSCF